MKKLLSLLTTASLALAVATTTLAKEPQNLFVAKQAAVKYHDSGEYNRDIKRTADQALSYLKQRLKKPVTKPAIILDIDETSLSNYADMKRLDFGGTIEEIRADEDKGTDPAIEPTLALYQFAKSHGVAVFFLTGRFDFERDATEENLKKAGYNNWDGLILRAGEYKTKPAADYKTAMRKQITEQGYTIIVNMGDQHSDLRGGYAEKTYKLPNPYYFIP